MTEEEFLEKLERQQAQIAQERARRTALIISGLSDAMKESRKGRKKNEWLLLAICVCTILGVMLLLAIMLKLAQMF